MTKKEIYAKHGIEYDPKTAKLFHPVFGWIKPLLKEGNSKTGKKVFTFSLPAGTEGTCTCDCPNCYAKSGFYCTPSVQNSLKLNQSIIETDIAFARNAIQAQIEADHIEQIRMHASGDFNTANKEDYQYMWFAIACSNESVKFWTYTKMREYETIFDDLPNANIVPSILPFKLGFNFDTIENLIEKYNAMIANGIIPHICECGINPDHHCENCSACSVNKYVLFILHSTKEYDANNDPLLPTIAEIIKRQKEG